MKYLIYFYLIFVIFCTTLSSGVRAQEEEESDGPGCVNETSWTPCRRCNNNGTFRSQNRIDECYMKEALNTALANSGFLPFAAIIVNHYTNTILCYGINQALNDSLNHGEMVAMRNCTARFPSPTGNDRTNPGVPWGNVTLYTTAEPCIMCSGAIIMRGVYNIVFGTEQPTLWTVGLPSTRWRTCTIIQGAEMSIIGSGENGGTFRAPYIKGGVLADEIDPYFFAAFGKTVPTSRFWKSNRDVLHGTCGCTHNH